MFVLALNESDVSDKKFSIYYNKTIRNIQIITSFTSLMKITIYNINGSQIVLKNQMDSKDKIDVSSFKSGVYILKANIEGKYFLRKFILY